MNRDDFLMNLYLMYKEKFNNENIPIWSKAYKVILKENWDYNLLFTLFIKNYDKTNIAPAPSYFLQFKSRVEPNKRKETQKQSEEIYTPPTEFFNEMRAKLNEAINKRTIKEI